MAGATPAVLSLAKFILPNLARIARRAYASHCAHAHPMVHLNLRSVAETEPDRSGTVPFATQHGLLLLC
jgi:hypothetical protein